MVSEAIFDTINRLLSSHAIESKLLNDNEIYLEVALASIKDDCSNIYKNIDCVLIDMFGNDTSEIDNSLIVYYTFAVRSSNTLITIYVKLDKNNSLLINSISKEIPAASLYEREIQDMFGIIFNDLIDSRELVHHGNFPLKVHPLNKKFKVNTRLDFEKRE
ncbi:MAG: NADH-quinone oxidoreductase subunit C, partial [Ruminiclostridium sp.]